MSDFGAMRYPTARKPHSCLWCAETIQVKEKHAHFKGKWEDEWQNWRMHQECYDAIKDTDYLMDGVMHGEGRRGRIGD